jgi:hypothetical protein
MLFTSIAGESTLGWLLHQPTWVWLAIAATAATGFLLYRNHLRARAVPMDYTDCAD